MSAVLLVIGGGITIDDYKPVSEQMKHEAGDPPVVITVTDDQVDAFIQTHQGHIADIPGYEITNRENWNSAYMRRLRSAVVRLFGVRGTRAVQNIVISEAAYGKLAAIEVSRSPGSLYARRYGVKYQNVLTLLYDLGCIFSMTRHVVYVVKDRQVHEVSNDITSVRL